MQRFYNESKEAALQAVKSSSQGLTQAEARARLERNGKNQLAQGKKDSLLKRFFLHDSHSVGRRRHQRRIGGL